MKSTRRMMKSIFGLFVLLLLCISLAPAGLSEKDKAQGPQKTNTNDLYRPFLINNVFNYYSNNGDGSFNKFSTDNEGFEFLKGTGKHVIFEDGVVWGGYHKGRVTPKVGGSVYRHGLQAGPIVTNGTLTTDPVAASSADPLHRIFRVRPDINPGTPFADVQAKIEADEIPYIGRYESYSAQDIYDQYVKDWNEWPVALGAPYKDLDSNGVYDPTKDIPGQPGSDQTLWYVSNDMNAAITNNLAGSPPIGLEMRRTIWGYRRAGALGQTIFSSSLIINKSGAPIDSMHLVQWSDPDLGDAGDDYAGCDTSRSLGFIYNGGAVDATYGVAVPAGGFDFFQGPIVAAPGDSAIFRLKRRYGVKNLPMTTFDFFSQGIAAFADPTQGPGGDIQWWRLMNATAAPSGVPFIDPTVGNPSSGQAVKFCLYGDPVKATDGSAGWVDGLNGLTAQDRRICLVTGPFTMAAGDTQELVVALVGGVGSDRLSSIAVLRSVDDKAQSAYNNLFVLPAPPPAPVVSVANMDNQVILTWGSPTGIAKTEGTVDQGFAFEGYKVYEYPGPSTAGAIELGTFDANNGIKAISDTVYDPATTLNLIEVVQHGTDAGVIRSMVLNSSKATGADMVNGTPYYFAVTAYSFNVNPPAAAGTHSLESPAQVIKVLPQSPAPGTRYTRKAGDTLVTTLTTAAGGSPSDGHVYPLVVDPTKLNGDTYQVTFALDNNTGITSWSLKDNTANKVLVTGAENQTGDEDYAISDGIKVKVQGPPPGMKGFATAANGNRDWTFAGADPGGVFPMEGYSGSIGNAYLNWFSSSTDTPDKMHDVKILFAAADGTWNPLVAQADTNYSRGHRFLRSAGNPPAQPSFAPWIINPTAGQYAYQDFNWSVPFAAWDIQSVPARRLAVGHLENNQPGGLVDGKYWPQTNAQAGADNTLSTGPREWFFIFDRPYSTTTADPALTQDILNVTMPIMWWGTCTRRAVAPNTLGNFRAGTEFTILANKVNAPSHTFTFTSAKPTIGDVSIARDDVTKINVYPNPYLGFNPLEINKYARFVTFTHMPAKATLRVFNLAGVLVRTMQKNDTAVFFQWDLTNDSGFPVSAGMYIVHIDMPDLGSTKILKLGVVPEQQYLDRW